ncbi:MAG TPA: hypothetical protein PKC76_17085 [Saprospiraceae bacterium]|nr:hypothetical protein [Saprospiraceae bacterium]HMP25849.1 hypothetical protein [Saprospiraceae bacterium]
MRQELNPFVEELAAFVEALSDNYSKRWFFSQQFYYYFTRLIVAFLQIISAF